MKLMSSLLGASRAHRPGAGPLRALLPALSRRRRGPVMGIYLRRLGGVRVLAATGTLPRLRGIEAIRGVCLAPVPIHQVKLMVDGGVAQVATTQEVASERPLRKFVFNIWHDFSEVAPGRHQVAVRPVGLMRFLLGRDRPVMIEPPPPADARPDSDAFIPKAPGDRRAPDAIVAALPSMARPTRRSPLPDPVRSILVIRADQLGDLVVSMAAVLRLRKLFPAARLVGLVTAANADLARTPGLFDALEIATYADAAGGDARVMSEAEQARLRAAFAPQRFDIAVDLGEGAGSRLLLLLSGARFLYGFRHGDHAWLSASFELNARDPANGQEVMPPSRKILALVEALGAMRAAPSPVLPPAPAPERLARYGIQPGERFLVLHTGARLVPSRWPGFAALATMLLARTPHKLVIFTHGERWETPADPAHADRLRVIDHVLPFEDFDALLGHCAVLVGNDSGPKHLSALRGAKVVSLHMARLNWSEWGQEGAGLIMSRRVPCAGCNIGDQPDECGRDYTCLRAITPEEVCAAVLSLL